MHYKTHISHQMQKHKFGVTCPGLLIMETAPDPPKHVKEHVKVSWPGCNGMHYVTHRSHQMQKKQKFGVTCPDALFIETTSGPPKHEK
jgi:hypothetical protein